MLVSNAGESYMKSARIILEVIPKYLRECFKKQWNSKYPDQQWQSDNVSGKFLFDKLPENVKSNKSWEKEIIELREGNEQTWDTTTLSFVLLYSGLNLIEASRSRSQRTRPMRVSEGIEIIGEFRKLFSQPVVFICKDADFSSTIEMVKSAAMDIFGASAEKEIEDIVNSQIEIKMMSCFIKQIFVEVYRIGVFGKMVTEMEGKI